MSGILPTEGENLVAQMIFKNTSVDRGTSTQLVLFTNSSITSAITASALTEPTGGSYARKSLADASWTITGAVASYSPQVFTGSGSAMVGSIKGYAIITTGTTPRILSIEVDPAGPYTINQNDTYTITPIVTII